jgi:hypothetical protein
VKYRSLIVAIILGLAGNTFAFASDSAADEADNDDRVACIEAAIADEVEKGDQFDQYVKDCFEDKVAQRPKPVQREDSNS